METLGYLLAAIGFIWIWDTKLREDLFFVPLKEGEIQKSYRIKLFRILDTAPIFGSIINCSTCITFWTGIILFIFTKDIFFLPLPIFYKLTVKHI